MKKLLLIPVLLVFAKSAFSQPPTNYIGPGTGISPLISTELPGGNIVMAGFRSVDSSIFVTKIHPETGTTIQFKKFRKPGPILFSGWYNFFFTSTGRLLLSGYTQGFETQYQPHPTTVIMMDTSLNIIWSKGMGNTYFDEIGGATAEIAPGKYALAVHPEGPQDSLSGTSLILFDENGVIFKLRNFRQNVDFGLNQILAMGDGTMLMVGGTDWPINPEYVFDGFIMRVDSNMNILWSKTYLGPYTSSFNWVVSANDGGIVCVGGAEEPGSSVFDILLTKVSVNGEVQWARRFQQPNRRLFIKDLIVDTDGGFLICGTYLHGAVTNYDGFIIKTDSVGVMEWASLFGDGIGTSTFFENVFSVFPRSDGYYYLGSTNFSGVNQIMGGLAALDGTPQNCYQHLSDITSTDVTADTYDSVAAVMDTLLTHTFYNFSFTPTDLTTVSGDLCLVGFSEVNSKDISITNPVDEILTIYWTGMEFNDGEIKIYDLSGRIVLIHNFSALTNSISMDCREFLPGFYLLELESGGQKIVKPFVKD